MPAEDRGASIRVGAAQNMNVVRTLLKKNGQDFPLFSLHVAFQHFAALIKQSVFGQKTVAGRRKGGWFSGEHSLHLLVGDVSLVNDAGAFKPALDGKPYHAAKQHTAKHYDGKAREHKGKAYRALSFRHL